jgi:hypothetical protein
MKKQENFTECINFTKCSAPICPKDQDSLKTSVWFPNEEICNQSNDFFIKNQRKVKIKAKDAITCYTHKMLNRGITIRSGITGIDPDKEIEIEEKKWIVKHPAKKEISEDRKAELRKRMQEMRSKKTA